jgi:hypothetical protein
LSIYPKKNLKKKKKKIDKKIEKKKKQPQLTSANSTTQNGGQPEWHNKLRQEGLDDMTLIARVNEDAILENLYKRFMKDIIYTNIGDVLVSMNPFYAIPGLYDDSVINDYCGKSRLELPPHIYAIAEQAYRSMMVDKENQCIVAGTPVALADGTATPIESVAALAAARRARRDAHKRAADGAELACRCARRAASASARGASAASRASSSRCRTAARCAAPPITACSPPTARWREAGELRVGVDRVAVSAVPTPLDVAAADEAEWSASLAGGAVALDMRTPLARRRALAFARLLGARSAATMRRERQSRDALRSARVATPSSCSPTSRCSAAQRASIEPRAGSNAFVVAPHAPLSSASWTLPRASTASCRARAAGAGGVCARVSRRALWRRRSRCRASASRRDAAARRVHARLRRRTTRSDVKYASDVLARCGVDVSGSKISQRRAASKCACSSLTRCRSPSISAFATAPTSRFASAPRLSSGRSRRATPAPKASRASGSS